MTTDELTEELDADDDEIVEGELELDEDELEEMEELEEEELDEEGDVEGLVAK